MATYTVRITNDSVSVLQCRETLQILFPTVDVQSESANSALDDYYTTVAQFLQKYIPVNEPIVYINVTKCDLDRLSHIMGRESYEIVDGEDTREDTREIVDDEGEDEGDFKLHGNCTSDPETVSESDSGSDLDISNTLTVYDTKPPKYVVFINSTPYGYCQTEEDASAMLWKIARMACANNLEYQTSIKITSKSSLKVLGIYKMFIMQVERTLEDVSYSPVYEFAQ